ncbi:hypothetical protein AVEN_97397-1 [Araneus ventricosus]|uniref:Uncharacterized protein n=1 Tax=Araneus ventricosus TaxID=182803 RepID=A0A4Y2KTM8_ARAVE|nr:hypothetical protein AVEN_97397-1 [Araneus ventricosus]
MLVDDALRDAAKDSSPTTTRKISSLPSQKSPMQSSSTRDSKAESPTHYGQNDSWKETEVFPEMPEDHRNIQTHITQINLIKILYVVEEPKTNFLLILVILPKTRENAAIHGPISIGYNKVTVEALRRKVSPGQCFKCQQNFHNSRFRKRDPVLAKCAGPHE